MTAPTSGAQGGPSRTGQNPPGAWQASRLLPKLAVAAFAGALAGAMLGPVAASARGSVSWTGGGDGTSWSSNQPPQTGDSVTISPTASEPTPHVTGMPSGTQLQDLTLADASLAGGDVVVMGTFSWNASQGHETLASPLTVEGDASF